MHHELQSVHGHASRRYKEIAKKSGLPLTTIEYLVERTKIRNIPKSKEGTAITLAQFNELPTINQNTLNFLCKTRLRDLFRERFKPAAIAKIMAESNVSADLAEKIFMNTFYRRKSYV
jgi:hypothetical protein